MIVVWKSEVSVGYANRKSRAVGRSHYRKAFKGDKFSKKQVGYTNQNAVENYEIRKKEAAIKGRSKIQFGNGSVSSFFFDVELEEEQKKEYESTLGFEKNKTQTAKQASEVIGRSTLAALLVKKFHHKNTWLKKFVGKKLSPRMVEIVLEITSQNGWKLDNP